MRCLKHAVVPFGIVTSLLSFCANAELVTVEAKGTISSITNNFGGLASGAVGDTLVVDYTFDTSIPAYKATGTSSYYGAITSFSYRINNNTISYQALTRPNDPVTQIGLANDISLANQKGGSVMYRAEAYELASTTNTGVKVSLDTYYFWSLGNDPGIIANTSITSLPDLAALYAAPDQYGNTSSAMSISSRNGLSTDSLKVNHLSSLAFVPVAPVPITSAIWLLGSGIVGMFATARRKVNKRAA